MLNRMPELPEVETTRRGIAPHLLGKTFTQAVVRNHRLRWPVPKTLDRALRGQGIEAVDRRGKYLLLRLRDGALILHLGMSGSLRVLPADTPPRKHDHIDLILDSGRALRLHDPRRFGSLHWTGNRPETHPLLADLGPEPLGDAFDGDYLHRMAQGRRIAVKAFLLNAHIVVGVGNIYANEALFRAGIHPDRPAGRIGLARYERLVAAVRAVLGEAIEQGGTTLRDFVSGDGQPGYFAQSLSVYGRAGQACRSCGQTLKSGRKGQRATVYCPRCQR